MPVSVEIVEHLGGETYVYARGGNADSLTIATDDGRKVKFGDKLAATFDPARMLLFDSTGHRLR